MMLLSVPDIPIVHIVRVTTVLTTSVTTTVLTVAGSAVAGGTAGALVSRYKAKGLRRRPKPMNNPSVDPHEQQQIRRIAHQWSATNGLADHEERVFNKLRLMRRLQRERRLHRGWPL
jgi:hypothetical protein